MKLHFPFLGFSRVLFATIAATVGSTGIPSCAQGLPDLVWMAAGHSREVNAVAFSPDGTLLASASDDFTVKLWRSADGILLQNLQGHSEDVQSVAFTPDGASVVSGGKDNIIRVWRVADGSLIRTVQEQGNFGPWRVQPRHSLAVSPDGTVVATASTFVEQGGSQRLYSLVNLRALADGRLLRSITLPSTHVRALAFSPDGARVACGTGVGVSLHRVADGSEERVFTDRMQQVETVAFTADGQMLAAAGDDRVIRVWQATDGVLLRRLAGHGNTIRSVGFSPDGSRLASGALDRTLRMWSNTGQGSLVWSVTGDDDFRAVAFAPDGTRLAAGTKNDTVAIHRADDGTQLRLLTGHADPVWSVAFSPDGTLLASAAGGGDANAVMLWRSLDGTRLRTWSGLPWAPYALRFSPDGQFLAAWGLGGWMIIWRVGNGALLWSDYGLHSAVQSFAFSPDWSLLAAARNNNRSVMLWHVAANGVFPFQELTAHSNTVMSVAFSADGALLATAGLDKTIKLWNTADAALIRTLPVTGEGPVDNPIVSLAFSPDGKTLLSGEGGTCQPPGACGYALRTWQLPAGNLKQLLAFLGNPFDYVTFSPNGEELAWQNTGRTTFLRVTPPAASWTLEGSLLNVSSLAASARWEFGASWDDHRTLQLWRMPSGPVPKLYDEGTADITAFTFSPDTTRFAYGRQDASLIVARNPLANVNPVQFGQPAVTANREFRFTINGNEGQTYTIMTSTNLARWTVLTNVFSVGSSLDFVDPTNLHRPHLFYRALSP